MKRIALLLTAAVLTACSDSITSHQKKAGHAATAFAEAYFNYDLQKALELSTPESEKWIKFMASNITQEDVDVLNTRTERSLVTLTDCEFQNDTTFEAVLEVDNYMNIDSIGRPGVFRKNGVFRLKVVQRDGNWKVRMEGLPRSEKRNHD